MYQKNEFQERLLSDKRLSEEHAHSRLPCVKTEGRVILYTWSDSERRHQEDMWDARLCPGTGAVSNRALHALTLLSSYLSLQFAFTVDLIIWGVCHYSVRLGLCPCLLPPHEVRCGTYQPMCAEWNEWKSKRIPISQLRNLRFREMKDNLPGITWPMWRGLRPARFWSPNSELLCPVSHERSWGSWILCSLRRCFTVVSGSVFLEQHSFTKRSYCPETTFIPQLWQCTAFLHINEWPGSS